MLPRIVAKAFLSLIPLSWKNFRAAFSFSLQPLQMKRGSGVGSGAISRIATLASDSTEGEVRVKGVAAVPSSETATSVVRFSI